MPEIRFNPLSGRGVIIAAERARRPFQNKSESAAEDRNSPRNCPFCKGNEEQTPAQTDSLFFPSSRDWAVRSVPNRYAALTPVSDPWIQNEFQIETGPKSSPLYWKRESASGLHEVIIESPQHVERCGDLDDAQWRRLIQFYVQRIQAAYSDDRWCYVQLFKNQGRSAGASMSHVHSQLMAMPIIPQLVSREVSQLEQYAGEYGECFWCTVLKTELEIGARIVKTTPNFAVLCPFISRFAGETWILPRVHLPSMENSPPEILDELAAIMAEILRKLESVLSEPAYNVIYRNAPRICGQIPGAFHWRVEITPRINSIAGFEIGTGYFINVISPEEFVSRLRE